jgi:hypothetical protein
MPDLLMVVDTALPEVPVNLMPLLDSTDFVTRETAVAYNAAGMDLVWNFVTPEGAFTQTAVTPTTAGTYDWAHQGDGMYTIEIPDTGGASINNNALGFGWFTGVATGVLPWRGPTIQFSPANVVNSLVLGTDKLQVHADEITAGLITATAIATGAIDADAIADNAIDAGAIATGAITAAKFAAGAIDAAAIADNAIDAGAIAANAITSAKIATGAITSGTFAAGAINAAAIAADAITDAKVASDVTIASVTGAVGSVAGAVGSVTGNVGGNVVGTVASVVGAVGSVTGNVGGNVTGSVGSIASGGITTASFAAGAINAAAIAADAITDAKVASDVTIASVTGSVGSVTGAVGSVTGAVGSVTGNVGGNVVGSVGSVTTVSDKTGYRLSATGVDDVWDEVMEGSLTARQFARGFAAALLGELSGAGTTTIEIRDASDTKVRITATVDSAGNRSVVVLDLT